MACLSVSIIVGSTSDLSFMYGCTGALERFGVPYTLEVLSAHRTPKALVERVEELDASPMTKIFICAAGKAAALAGVVAAHTLKPVYAVPIKTSMMGGLDSLLSTVQMPAGVPVASFGVGESGATNAALMAVRTLSMIYPGMRSMLQEARKKQAADILEANANMAEAQEQRRLGYPKDSAVVAALKEISDREKELLKEGGFDGDP